MNRANELIQNYGMRQHPEGGWFIEGYTAPYMYQSDREACGSIYFLLSETDISHFHVIDCDEIWYYHEGCGMLITMIDPNGKVNVVKLGMDIANDEKAMVVIPKGVIFAAENLDNTSYTFVSCVTTPQFRYTGFRLVKESEVTCDISKMHHLFMDDEQIDHMNF